MIALPVLALRQCGIWIFFAGELETRVSAEHYDPERAALPVPSTRGERRGGVVKHSHSTRDREARAMTFTVSVPLVNTGFVGSVYAALRVRQLPVTPTLASQNATINISQEKEKKKCPACFLHCL